MKTLRDLGERDIITQIISKNCAAEIGNDCADIHRPTETLIVTMDPVPPPAAEVIGGDADPYWKGWLLVVINASDLAAAAATPLSFFVAAEAPTTLRVDEFERFFEGVSDACKQEGLSYAGGNIREGAKLAAVGTAIGFRDHSHKLGRDGINDGDLLVVIGEGGKFWLDALLYDNGHSIQDKSSSPLFAPKSELYAMGILNKGGVISAAMDNSDGLLPSIEQLIKINGIGAKLYIDALPEPRGYSESKHIINISHQRLWLGWGDWNIVASVPRDKKSMLLELQSEYSLDITICGEFNSDISGLQIQHIHRSETVASPRLDSERFAADSWFSEGIDGYINRLKSVTLPGGV